MKKIIEVYVKNRPVLMVSTNEHDGLPPTRLSQDWLRSLLNETTRHLSLGPRETATYTYFEGPAPAAHPSRSRYSNQMTG